MGRPAEIRGGVRVKTVRAFQRPVSLAGRLRARIRDEGPLPLDEWMRACLYDEESGYYARGPRIGGAGSDFYTAADLPSFPRAIARLARAVADKLDVPARVIEIGAGTGALARGLTAEDVEVTGIVETSPAVRARCEADGFRVESDVRAFAGFEGLVIGNEIVDAFPVRRFRRLDEGWIERAVAVDLRDAFIEVDLARSAQAFPPEFVGYSGLPEGSIVDVQVGVAGFVSDLSRSLARGAITLIDYGSSGRESAQAHPRGTLRAYAGHAVLDYLAPEPGSADLTADVDFDGLARFAAQEKFGVQGPVSQGSFLFGLGAAEDYAALAATDPLAALKAKTLFLPGGMGERFRAIAFTRGLTGALAGFADPWDLVA